MISNMIEPRCLIEVSQAYLCFRKASSALENGFATRGESSYILLVPLKPKPPFRMIEKEEGAANSLALRDRW